MKIKKNLQLDYVLDIHPFITSYLVLYVQN